MGGGPIRIGVFIPNDSQLIDMASVDVLGILSKEYLSAVRHILPEHIYDLAPNVNFYYIGSGTEIALTSGATLKATHKFTDEAVAPGHLDIVMVPGPDPASEYDEEALDWLRRQNDTPGVDVLCVCTGIFVCAASGIADGKNVSGPRGMQGMLKKKFPDIKLVGDKYRWVQDGNLWSSGGLTNGNDMMAAYARESGRWAKPLVELGLIMAETGDRPRVYGEGATMLGLRLIWNLARGWFSRRP